jgi:hypothetical protein
MDGVFIPLNRVPGKDETHDQIAQGDVERIVHPSIDRTLRSRPGRSTFS